MYGKMGSGDREVIDTYLTKLKEGAVVVNLGCGPNGQLELNNFARSVWKFQSAIVVTCWSAKNARLAKGGGRTDVKPQTVGTALPSRRRRHLAFESIVAAAARI